jgi:hypothetical protein
VVRDVGVFWQDEIRMIQGYNLLTGNGFFIVRSSSMKIYYMIVIKMIIRVPFQFVENCSGPHTVV